MGKQSCIMRHIDVKTRGYLSSTQCTTLVRELVKHLLYMRNQIPDLFEDLEWQVQASPAKFKWITVRLEHR